MITQAHPSSFRDPSGYIITEGEKIFRVITAQGLVAYEAVRNTGLIQALITQGWLLPETEVPLETLKHVPKQAKKLLTHPRLPMITYPYEWPFAALKAAALRHLEIQITALSYDVVLSDASAFNMQLIGSKPVFIDHLSFRPYQSGEYWLAHEQFCREFLNPLLLKVYLGVEYHHYYRGSMKGISTETLASLLPLHRKIHLNTLLHVILPAYLNKKSKPETLKKASLKTFPKTAYLNLLKQLFSWISKLELKEKTRWKDYAVNNHYDEAAAQAKKTFIENFISMTKPKTVVDLGCNQGEYALLALKAGAKSVIGLDTDQGALHEAYQKAALLDLPFMPLVMDIANPSPNQGFAGKERDELTMRLQADALLSLAIIHHLRFTHYVPIAHIVAFLTSLAPQGVIEFIPKTDPLVQQMLCLRGDIFPDYDMQQFMLHLQNHATIIQQKTITASGRTLFWYRQ